MTETPNPYIRDTDTLTGDLRPIRQAVLSLGSNLAQRLSNLQGAVDALSDTPGVSVVAVSAVYETVPVDAPEESPPFLNAVVLVDSTLSVHTLMERCRAVEDAFGRERSRVHAPRTLDVDLITVGQRIASDVELVLPHPRAHERAFVLRPWLEIDIEAQIPGLGAVADLIEQVDESGINRRDDLRILV